MSATTSTAAPPHILIFPYPAQGHTLPLLDLTHQLCLRRLTVTIISTPKNLPTLSPLLSLHHPSTLRHLLFPFPSHPSLPAGVENVKEIGNKANFPIINALAKLHPQIVHWFQTHPSPPVALISDFFLGWTLHLADQLGIPRITFFSSGSFLASVVDHCWKNIGTVRDLPTVEFHHLPGSPSFREEHLPSVFRFYRESDPDSEFVRDGMIANTSSWGCIFNSFDALEGPYLDCLKKKMGHERVFGVGPVSLIGPENASRGESEIDPDSSAHIFAWLDGCSDGSVLYVCFGSQTLLKREQMEALALGLENSGTRFIWVVKTGTTRQIEEGYGVIPTGFEERVAGRGLVIKGWAPQVRILSHRSVGGFLSHCGWNSVQEGIVAGTVILGWPMDADQHVNARLLVEDLGVGVRVSEGVDSVPDSDDLGRFISEIMRGYEEEKARAKKLRDEALAAVKEGGSSFCDLERLVKELGQLQAKDD